MHELALVPMDLHKVVELCEKSTREYWTDLAVDLLATAAEPEALLQYVAALIEQSDFKLVGDYWYVWARAVSRVPSHGQTRTQLLCRLVEYGDRGVREAAIDGLKLCGEAGLPRLKSLARSDPDPFIWQYAREVLAEP